MDIEKQYDLPFSVETVFSAWTSSETIIPPATRMNITPRVGGEFVLFVETPQFNARTRGRFKEFLPNEKLVYSWEWNDDGEETEITVDFAAAGKGTLLNLTHSGWQKEESRQMHDSGWDSYIEGLTAFLTSRN